MNLDRVSDDLIIQEAIIRLLKRVKKISGLKLKYGNFLITLHDGICSTVEFNFRKRCFSAEPFKLQGGTNG